MRRRIIQENIFGEKVQPSVFSESQISLPPLVLEDGETIERIAFGQVLHKNGVLVATDRRLVYLIALGVGNSKTETFRYGDIESFMEKDIDKIGYKKLTITNIFGYKYTINSIDQLELKNLLDFAKPLNNEFKLMRRRKRYTS